MLFAGDLMTDQVLFNAMYDQYHQAVYANIFKYVKDKQFAEDILQEVFFIFWEKRLTLKEDIGGWLFVVSHNKSLNFLNKKITEPTSYISDYSDYQLSTEYYENESEELESQFNLLEEAIESLSPQRQAVFKLCKFEGKSVKDVASQLGLTVHTVHFYLKQSKILITNYIKDKETLGGFAGGVVTLLMMINNS